MTHNLFPERIETRRLVFERISHEYVNPFEFYEFVSRDDWQSAVSEHMPWYHFERLDHVADFIDKAEREWVDRDSARYLLRSKNEENAIIGITDHGLEWEAKRAKSGIVLAEQYWGNEYGLERASVFIELTFEKYDLHAYYTTCAANNENSRRLIEKYIEKYGGRYEGLLRQYSPRPNGDVTDQHRFTIVRPEYFDATYEDETMDFEITW
jgi:[ribosomal protein S5]-alanine N-acetyltransferase